MVFCSSCQFCTLFRSASPLLHIELRSVQEQHARKRGRVKKGWRCKICVGDPTRHGNTKYNVSPVVGTSCKHEPLCCARQLFEHRGLVLEKESHQCSSLAWNMFVVGCVRIYLYELSKF